MRKMRNKKKINFTFKRATNLFEEPVTNASLGTILGMKCKRIMLYIYISLNAGLSAMINCYANSHTPF